MPPDFHDNFLITSVNKTEKGRLFAKIKNATKYHSIVITDIEIGNNFITRAVLFQSL
jgi:hypothetical protein